MKKIQIGGIELSNKNNDHVDLMAQIYQDFEKNEDMKSNPGFGKPLPKNLFKGDVYQNFLNTAKNAGYLPPWIKEQKEIKEKLSALLPFIEENSAEAKIANMIAEINEKIKKYNKMCPPQMQRGMINADNVRKQYELWH
ncbi:DnaJ family domain-containing protein [Bacillus chungangensis]|uniref:DnaJ homologue subfamily C member 28 conserved domain-containing protein n=1 Tax=Bacillus chungangensis TaxID=587633 RepID=A0ABT9WNB3_9BACI|nr:DnaJ family domain-containing protein [Bacillus chungangensis]MDQ0174773.1 hypothetical protein [Bacillus chungangensis]